MRTYPPPYTQDIPALADPAMPSEGCCESQGGNVGYLSRSCILLALGWGHHPHPGAPTFVVGAMLFRRSKQPRSRRLQVSHRRSC